MGLAFFFLFLMTFGGAALSACFLTVGVQLWRRSGWKVLSALFFLLGLGCAAGAVFAAIIVWREPPWDFRL